MPDSRTAALVIEDVFGAGPTPRLARRGERWVTWVEEYTGAGAWHVQALASGATTGEAWANLIRACYATNHDLSTAEVAGVLGVTDSQVRRLAGEGKLIPSADGTGNRSARYQPAAVLAYAGLAHTA